MSDTFVHDLKLCLDNCISELDSIRSLFCRNPETDFTRNRKISFPKMLNFFIGIQAKSLSNELLDYFQHASDTPTASALIQQWNKLLPEAFEYLFHSFNHSAFSCQSKTYRGYRLLACDGSDLNIARNPRDEESFIHEGERGYNAIHLNALYDLLNHTYVDINIQGKKKLHERQALNLMVDRYSCTTPSIFIADRGYESFNTFAHLIRKNQDFIIRLKDISSNGILSGHGLPDDEFDTYIQTRLTRRHTKETKNNPDIYTIIPPNTDFDFLDQRNPYYNITFRIVRFKVSNGKYICVATTLPEEAFPLEEIKRLYKYRWGEETSFRELKYTIGLLNFHSGKRDFILQEIYARLILYNFCEIVTMHAVVKTKENSKHVYKINFATAVNICKAYLKGGSGETEIMLLIQRHLTPIRTDRKYALRLRPKRNRDFVYRLA